MPKTQVRSHQILDEGIKRDDINTSTEGQAIITKVVAGTGVSLESTGADAGTGDVTINVSVAEDFVNKNGSVAFTGNQSMGSNKLTNLANPSDAKDATNKEYVDSVVGSVDKFDYDGDDLMPAAMDSKFIFEFDGNDDLMPTISGYSDPDFELDGNNDIQPIS